MIELTAYVRNGFRSGNVDICTVCSPLPEGLKAFGEYQDEYVEMEGRADDFWFGFVRIPTRNGRFAPAWIALDWLREQGWTVCPDVPQFNADQIGYLTASRMKDRGWTPKLIETYLVEPDKEVSNPHYRTSSPMRLYAKTRVLLLEQKCPVVTESVTKYMARREARTKAKIN
jgi:hypothetical protein